jgi:hypothetical protein
MRLIFAEGKVNIPGSALEKAPSLCNVQICLTGAPLRPRMRQLYPTDP